MAEKNMLRLSALLFGIVFLVACSTDYSTARDDATGRQRLYALNNEQSLAIAHNAIVSTFPGRPLTTIQGPTQGYSTYTRFGLDTFAQQVLLRPVAGTTADGQVVEGYTFDVSGSGTSGSGAIRNANFFRRLQADLDASGGARDVVELRPRTLASSVPIGQIRPAADGSTEPAQQLRRLRDLHEQGLITTPEYNRARAEVVRRL